MSLATPIREALAAARRRHALIVAAFALPVLAFVAVSLAKDASWPHLLLLGMIASVVPMLAWVKRPGRDPRALARRLDARPDLEDSTDLLFTDPATLGPLQRMQRQRLVERLSARPADLRTPWPRGWLLLAWALFSLLVAATLLMPPYSVSVPLPQRAPSPAAAPAAQATDITLASAALRIEPPAYTGLAASSQGELSAKLPQDATLRWRLRFEPQPEAAELVFHDGQRLPLTRDGEDWTAARTLSKSTLYRIVPAGPLPLRDDALHRLDAVPDRPPPRRAPAPESAVTVV